MGIRSARLGSVVLATAVLGIAPATVTIPRATAACPAAEVVFARGREEPPGVGYIGQAFVNALQAKVSMPVASYGVNYPADVDPAKGATDMSNHVQSMAKHCPTTREVLGGYSLGAISADLVVAATQPAFGFKNPLPPGVDQNVAAVALFGNGTRRVLGPVPDFSPAFAGKTIDQCAPGDPICSSGTNWPSHLQPSYINSGLVDQAAGFAAGRLR
ncbi:cutinase family protein [Mycobacterium shigaense]|uniref:Putative cutinase cut2 n=1 Tax=Mycobacterium shigaense TaxID=722731 RepID=A0A1Z4EDW1_9MYCO|nr:cutinase family protein [Mycobacterium shigaense]MEA1124302.1 cutinase family protein [Mycobacterium shigaense]PRI13488.1 cutinase family protein [Mycobacterium shigaense]BAX91147.1 putative cutinase cut2 [Mycobacterium shigaense]